MNRRIPIIADAAVDLSFGTGAVKVTPAHDPTDFEIGQRHELPSINVIDFDARMTPEAGPFAGQDRYEARKNLKAELERLGLLDNEQDYTIPLGHCKRCDTVIEPLISMQWWVKTAPLATPAINAVRYGQTHRAGALHQDLHRLDGEHSRLEHLAPVVVGPPHPGVVLRRL